MHIPLIALFLMMLAICFDTRATAATTAAAAAAAFIAALLGIGTADAGFPTLFCPMQIPGDAADDTQQNYNDDKIFHSLFTKWRGFYFDALRAYSVFIFFFVLAISRATITAITATAARPASAAPIFRAAGAVISVPMV